MSNQSEPRYDDLFFEVNCSHSRSLPKWICVATHHQRLPQQVIPIPGAR
jgi:hypothetical protein